MMLMNSNHCEIVGSMNTQKKHKEAGTDASHVTLQLRPYDVLLGRTKIAHANPGNKLFRDMIQEHCPKYRKAKSRDEKKNITFRIIEAFESQGGRFLVLVNDKQDRVEEVSDEYRYEKVSHALRSARPKKVSEPAPKEFLQQQAEKINELRRVQSNILKQDVPYKCENGETETSASKVDCFQPRVNEESIEPMDALDPYFELEIDHEILEALVSL